MKPEIFPGDPGCQWIVEKERAERGGITCIVAAHQNAKALRCCLASLVLQEPHVQVIVADTSPDDHGRRWNYTITKNHDFNYISLPKYTPEAAALAVAPMAIGEWLCFPSDTSYFVPRFAEVFLNAAPRTNVACWWSLDYTGALRKEAVTQSTAVRRLPFIKEQGINHEWHATHVPGVFCVHP